MNLSNPFRTELSRIPYLDDALDLILARINQVFSVEHATDGSHGDVTAESVTVAQVTRTGAVVDEGVISPAQITADQNNYNPTGLSTARVLRLSSDAARTITGLMAQTGGTWLLIANGGAQDIVLAHSNGSSDVANIFICPGLVNFTLNAGDSVQVWRDGASSVWRVVAA